MEFHILPIVTFLMLAVAANAALSPEFYWKSVLPTTPMPKAITDLLHPDWKEEKDGSVDVGNGGVNVGVEKGNQGQGGGTDVNVGGGNGGVNVHAGPKGKPVHVGVGVGPHSPFDYSYGATETQLRDDPNLVLFFLEKNLHHGTKLDLQFSQTSNAEATFLPRPLADSIPFSSNKVNDILNRFSINAGSDEAQVVKNTISECERPIIRGEEKRCVTSLESMVDFATSKLGNNVGAISTNVKKESEWQKYKIAAGVKKLGEKSVVCHKEKYPYAVFYCHKSDSTKAYSVPLEGTDGSRVKAVAVCHTDTSNWNPKHLAFQVLKVQPGTVPVCHFLPQDHVVFVPK